MWWKNLSLSTIPKEVDDRWTVIPKTVFGSGARNESQYHKSNKIKTTKYSILNFIPKNLFEQFHRFANIYFLMIIILNFIPQIGAFGKEIAMLPLIFVLAVTAIKDLVEDRQRYNSDKMVNNRLVKVYESETDEFSKKKWKHVEVGDIVMLHENAIIPCDILLLHSSDENGTCHISTVNLDGESNLKQKKVPKGFLQEENNFQCKEIAFQVKCEQPNNKLHSFYGYIVHQNGEEIGVDRNNLLLRGCVLKNTEYIYGLVIYAGHDTKALLNDSGPRYKRSRLEKDINKDVAGCVAILFTFCLIGAICCGFWTKDYAAFENLMSTDGAETSPVYEGFLRFWTFVIVLQVIIPISLYVSVEIVKLGQVYFMNRDKEMIYEHTAQYPVCRATNINEDLGQIHYIFSDKTGTLTENKMVFKKFSIGGISCLHPDDVALDVTTVQCQQVAAAVSKDQDPEFAKTWDEFFTALAICNTVVIGEQPDITDETLKTTLDDTCSLDESRPVIDSKLQAQVVNQNGNSSLYKSHNSLTVPHLSDAKIARTNSLHVSTGDLTESFIMQRKCVYSKLINNRLSKSVDSISSWLDHGLIPKYEYESPDEGALVKAASLYGYILANRTSDQIIFTGASGSIRIFDILQVLQFDSTRKRMSIIVRDDKGKIKIYSKGADTAIMMRLKEGQDDIQQKTDDHLENFAREGLRTLCVAKRDLSEDEYNSWLNVHKEFEVALENRDSKLAESANAIENDLQLLGATGIEDKLQDGVPETIASLKNAGINIWILTGDKQETAVNIGFSCKLLNPNMEIITINASTKSECCETLDQIIQRLHSHSPSYTIQPTSRGVMNSSCELRSPLALIIDGVSLSFALEEPLEKKFIELAKCCESVICCRAAPIQKAAVVQLVREHLKVMTLAIGDGANDVSMLQMAEIGVGIAGEEGVQAAMASDFVLGRFRFLKQLLLVHGFWCYDRIARMIVYFFYKNTMFIALLFWYQIFNGFSGSNAIDDVSLILFNFAFTSLPPIICGVFDQCVPRQAILSKPMLYQWGQDGKAYTRKLFWLNILDAIFQSLVLFFIPYLTFSDMPFGMLVVGATYHQLAVLTANLHIGLETPNWTVVHAIIIIGSIVISYLYYFIYCIIPPILNMYWVIYKAMSTSEFWFLNILCPLVALLPRTLWKAFGITFFPTVVQQVQKHCDTHESVSQNGSLRTFSDTSYRTDENAIHASTPT